MHKFTQTGLAVQTLVLALLAGASALSHSGEYIVNAQEVKQAIARGAQVWDVRDEKQAIAGRIPGALNAGNPSAKLRDADKEDFVSTERIEAYFSNLGIKPGNEVVVYGARGAWVPYFSQYALNHHGVKTVRVFHDGIEEWTAAGEIVETGSLSPSKASAFKSNIDPSLVIGTAELLTKRQNVQLVDVRTPQEFSGEDVRAIRGGHIPGAISIPYEQNWKDPAAPEKVAKGDAASAVGLALKSREDLAKLYAGLDKSRETVVYCQSGARASETAGVLRDLGFKEVKVYDSSWIGYAVSNAPVAQETQLDVARLEREMAVWREENMALRAQLKLAEPRASATSVDDTYRGNVLWGEHRGLKSENSLLRKQAAAAKTS